MLRLAKADEPRFERSRAPRGGILSDWTPRVSQSRLFDEHPASRFAVGIVAYGRQVVDGLEAERHAYGLLRGNIYAHQKHYMPATDLNPDGTESDEDDTRSIHFGLFENTELGVEAVGAMRLIIKEADDAPPLPIELHYPTVFAGAAAPKASVEVSRLIGRHESPSIQRRLKWPLFAASVSYILDNQLGVVFGAVEKELEERLRHDGVPVVALAEPHFVPEFNAEKLPIRVDIASLGDKLSADVPSLFEAAHRVERAFVYLDIDMSADAVPVEAAT